METTKNFKGELHFDVPVGYVVDGEYTRSIELLKTNGIAEEVFSKKLAEKPYTWIANVIAVAVGKIGNVNVGSVVRDNYRKTGSVEIPKVLLNMPLADANTLLVEIHRRVWQNLIPRQEIMCKYCVKTMHADIDLSRIVMDERNQKIMDAQGDNPYEFIVADLEDGFTVNDWLNEMKKMEELGSLKDKVFNQLVFRIPTLGDAIRNERTSVTDNVKFWRKMAFDALVFIRAVKDGQVIDEFPTEQKIFLGNKLFDNYLYTADLRIVRDAIRDDLPTFPFYYTDICPCDSQREIPYAMEASSFFSV